MSLHVAARFFYICKLVSRTGSQTVACVAGSSWPLAFQVAMLGLLVASWAPSFPGQFFARLILGASLSATGTEEGRVKHDGAISEKRSVETAGNWKELHGLHHIKTVLTAVAFVQFVGQGKNLDRNPKSITFTGLTGEL